MSRASARNYQPTAGTHTAGQLRRATERAFDRHLAEGYDTAAAAAIGAAVQPTQPLDLVADELTRAPVPNRAQRRAQIKAYFAAERKKRTR